MGIVEDLEWAIDIIELVSRYTKIKKSWVNYKWLCPFPWHSEKTPSFMVSPVKQIGYCFGCHKWWWPIKFIMDIENCEFRDATEILWEFTWIKVNKNFDKEKFKISKSLFSLYKDAVNYYKNALSHYPDIKKYITDRWLKEETISKFNFWYADSWIELYNYLKDKWYDDNLISESFIFLDIKTKKDKFINRIIFPIQNLRGDFVALAGRIIWKWEPKYLNSPASKVYDKSSILYWLFYAKTNIIKEDFIIITEWYMDTISLWEANFFNSVAVCWTALTEKHLQIIKRLTTKLYLCFDNDSAWEKATKWSLEILKNQNFEVKIIILKWWKDPDEIIKKWWDFKNFIDNAKTPIWYYIEKSNFDLNSIEEKKKLLNILIDMIKSYSDNIEKDFYLKEVSKLLDIDTKIVYDLFNRIRLKIISNESKIENKIIKNEDIAIAYTLIDKKNIFFFKKNIIFKEWLNIDLIDAIEKWNNFLNDLNLEKKEKYKWLSLKIEEDNKLKTEFNSEKELEKLVIWINKEIYKKQVNTLKLKINSWNTDAFNKYNELVKKAKEMWIK